MHVKTTTFYLCAKNGEKINSKKRHLPIPQFVLFAGIQQAAYVI